MEWIYVLPRLPKGLMALTGAKPNLPLAAASRCLLRAAYAYRPPYPLVSAQTRPRAPFAARHVF